MPYNWTTPAEGKTLTLRPHTSLPRRGFVTFVAITFIALMLPLLAVLGTAVLWGLLPFILIVFGALWWGLQHSYKSAELREVLTITAKDTHLIRHNPRGAPQEWTCNTYWVKPELHPKGGPASGPVPFYLTLRGNARTVEIGTFLTPQERQILFGELNQVLRSLASPQPPHDA